MSDYICPSCKSENTQRLSMVHISGTSKSTHTGIGIGTSGGIGLGIGNSTHQSQLSKIATPPKLSSPTLGAIGAFFVSIWLAVFANTFINIHYVSELIFIILFLGSFIITYKAYLYFQAKNNTIMKEYESKFICIRCGAIFKTNK